MRSYTNSRATWEMRSSARTRDGRCTMEQFRDGRSIPPGSIVQGGNDEKQGKRKNDENLERSMDYTGKQPRTVCRRTATEDPLRQPTSASQYEAPRQIAGKLFTRHMFVSSVHLVSQDPLQESCLRFMPWRPPMRSCYKIHIVRFMFQHLCVSGSFARSLSLDSCLSIHVYLRVLCKIHAAGFIAQQPYVSQDPLQDPRLQVHVSCLSIFETSQAPLQDRCLRIRI